MTDIVITIVCLHTLWCKERKTVWINWGKPFTLKSAKNENLRQQKVPYRSPPEDHRISLTTQKLERH